MHPYQQYSQFVLVLGGHLYLWSDNLTKKRQHMPKPQAQKCTQIEEKV